TEDGGAVLLPLPPPDEAVLTSTSCYAVVQSDPGIQATVQDLQDVFENLLGNLHVELNWWDRYRRVWSSDKETVITEFSKELPTVQRYDEQLAYYAQLELELQSRQPCIQHTSARRLSSEIVAQSCEWVQLLGGALLHTARNLLHSVLHQVLTAGSALQSPVSDRAGVVAALRSISSVRSDLPHLTASLAEARAMLLLLQYYRVKVDVSDMDRLKEAQLHLELLHPTAQSLLASSAPMACEHRDALLQSMRSLQDRVASFALRFLTSGPEADTVDIEEGCLLMQPYELELQELQSEQQELDHDGDAFDLPVLHCPQLQHVSSRLSVLRPVYVLYTRVKHLERSWSVECWRTADIVNVCEDIEAITVELQDTQTKVGHTSVAVRLLQLLERHKAGLQISMELRHRAVHQRHWALLCRLLGDETWCGTVVSLIVVVWDCCVPHCRGVGLLCPSLSWCGTVVSLIVVVWDCCVPHCRGVEELQSASASVQSLARLQLQEHEALLQDVVRDARLEQDTACRIDVLSKVVCSLLSLLCDVCDVSPTKIIMCDEQETAELSRCKLCVIGSKVRGDGGDDRDDRDDGDGGDGTIVGLQELQRLLDAHSASLIALERCRSSSPHAASLIALNRDLVAADWLLQSWQATYQRFLLLRSPPFRQCGLDHRKLMCLYREIVHKTKGWHFVMTLAYNELYLTLLRELDAECRRMLPLALEELLPPHRRSCKRLHYLEDHDMAMLLADCNSTAVLKSVLPNLLNLKTLTEEDGQITGVISHDNEYIPFEFPVPYVPREFRSSHSLSSYSTSRNMNFTSTLSSSPSTLSQAKSPTVLPPAANITNPSFRKPTAFIEPSIVSDAPSSSSPISLILPRFSNSCNPTAFDTPSTLSSLPSPNANITLPIHFSATSARILRRPGRTSDLDVRTRNEETQLMGDRVEQVIKEQKSSYKAQVFGAIELIKKYGKLTEEIIFKYVTSAALVAWRLDWAERVEQAIRVDDQTLRSAALVEVTVRALTDVEFLRKTMFGNGRSGNTELKTPVKPKFDNMIGGHKETFDEKLHSSVRNPEEKCSLDDTRAFTASRVQPLLLAILEAVDITNTLAEHKSECITTPVKSVKGVRYSTTDIRSRFVAAGEWLLVPRYVLVAENKLFVRVADHELEFGFEYGAHGGGVHYTTAEMLAPISTIMSCLGHHTTPLVQGRDSTGRRLVQAAASFCGRHIISVRLGPSLPSNRLASLLKGAMLSGSWLEVCGLDTATDQQLAQLTAFLCARYTADRDTAGAYVIKVRATAGCCGMLRDATGCYGLLWDAVGCYGMLWDAVECCGMLWGLLNPFVINEEELRLNELSGLVLTCCGEAPEGSSPGALRRSRTLPQSLLQRCCGVQLAFSELPDLALLKAFLTAANLPSSETAAAAAALRAGCRVLQQCELGDSVLLSNTHLMNVARRCALDRLNNGQSSMVIFQKEGEEKQAFTNDQIISVTEHQLSGQGIVTDGETHPDDCSDSSGSVHHEQDKEITGVEARALRGMWLEVQSRITPNLRPLVKGLLTQLLPRPPQRVDLPPIGRSNPADEEEELDIADQDTRSKEEVIRQVTTELCLEHMPLQMSDAVALMKTLMEHRGAVAVLCGGFASGRSTVMQLAVAALLKAQLQSPEEGQQGLPHVVAALHARLCRITDTDPHHLQQFVAVKGLAMSSELLEIIFMLTVSSPGPTYLLVVRRPEDIPAWVLEKCALIQVHNVHESELEEHTELSSASPSSHVEAWSADDTDTVLPLIIKRTLAKMIGELLSYFSMHQIKTLLLSHDFYERNENESSATFTTTALINSVLQVGGVSLETSMHLHFCERLKAVLDDAIKGQQMHSEIETAIKSFRSTDTPEFIVYEAHQSQWVHWAQHAPCVTHSSRSPLKRHLLPEEQFSAAHGGIKPSDKPKPSTRKNEPVTQISQTSDGEIAADIPPQPRGKVLLQEDAPQLVEFTEYVSSKRLEWLLPVFLQAVLTVRGTPCMTAEQLQLLLVQVLPRPKLGLLCPTLPLVLVVRRLHLVQRECVGVLESVASDGGFFHPHAPHHWYRVENIKVVATWSTNPLPTRGCPPLRLCSQWDVLFLQPPDRSDLSTLLSRSYGPHVTHPEKVAEVTLLIIQTLTEVYELNSLPFMHAELHTKALSAANTFLSLINVLRLSEPRTPSSFALHVWLHSLLCLFYFPAPTFQVQKLFFCCDIMNVTLNTNNDALKASVWRIVMQKTLDSDLDFDPPLNDPTLDDPPLLTWTTKMSSSPDSQLYKLSESTRLDQEHVLSTPNAPSNKLVGSIPLVDSVSDGTSPLDKSFDAETIIKTSQSALKVATPELVTSTAAVASRVPMKLSDSTRLSATLALLSASAKAKPVPAETNETTGLTPTSSSVTSAGHTSVSAVSCSSSTAVTCCEITSFSSQLRDSVAVPPIITTSECATSAKKVLWKNFTSCHVLTMNGFRETLKQSKNTTTVPGLDWYAELLASILLPGLHSVGPCSWERDLQPQVTSSFLPQSSALLNQRTTQHMCSCFTNEAGNNYKSIFKNRISGFLEACNDAVELTEDSAIICPHHPQKRPRDPCIFLVEGENLDGLQSLRLMCKRLGLCLLEPCDLQSLKNILLHLINQKRRHFCLNESDFAFLGRKRVELFDSSEDYEENEVSSELLSASDQQYKEHLLEHHQDVRCADTEGTVIIDAKRVPCDVAFKLHLKAGYPFIYMPENWFHSSVPIAYFLSWPADGAAVHPLVVVGLCSVHSLEVLYSSLGDTVQSGRVLVLPQITRDLHRDYAMLLLQQVSDVAHMEVNIESAASFFTEVHLMENNTSDKTHEIVTISKTCATEYNLMNTPEQPKPTKKSIPSSGRNTVDKLTEDKNLVENIPDVNVGAATARSDKIIVTRSVSFREEHASDGSKNINLVTQENDVVDNPNKVVGSSADHDGSIGKVQSSSVEEKTTKKSKETTKQDLSDACEELPQRFGCEKIEEAICYFATIFDTRKESSEKKKQELEQCLARLEALKAYENQLKLQTEDLRKNILDAYQNITQLSEDLTAKRASVIELERQVTKLRESEEAAQASVNEMEAEVNEFRDELHNPLAEALKELANLDMSRIKKLLSRSPIAAIQLMFECCVYLLGSSDVSMRAVRQATHDPDFCTKLTLLDVSQLSHERLAFLTHRLDVRPPSLPKLKGGQH
ncbi:hypothetical protein FHG87_010797, partial [Trinorchestia longiramus]